MDIQTIGIFSPDDMGQAIAAVLNQNGLKTIAALDNRSERTRQLAATANIQDVGSLTQLVIESDVILSVIVPAAATEAAKQIAKAISNVGKQILYVDCNAIAPQKVKNIAQIIESSGGTFVDASIIGPPLRVPNRTRIYTSGKQAHQLQQLRDRGLDVRVIGDEIGQASGLKRSECSQYSSDKIPPPAATPLKKGVIRKSPPKKGGVGGISDRLKMLTEPY